MMERKDAVVENKKRRAIELTIAGPLAASTIGIFLVSALQDSADGARWWILAVVTVTIVTGLVWAFWDYYRGKPSEKTAEDNARQE
jgi:hypothetical protein